MEHKYSVWVYTANDTAVASLVGRHPKHIVYGAPFIEGEGNVFAATPLRENVFKHLVKSSLEHIKPNCVITDKRAREDCGCR